MFYVVENVCVTKRGAPSFLVCFLTAFKMARALLEFERNFRMGKGKGLKKKNYKIKRKEKDICNFLK